MKIPEDDPGVRSDQERVQDALQGCHTHSMPDGSLLTGWVVVAEFMDPDGEKWISRLSHSGSTRWFSNGLLHYALHEMEDAV